MKTQTKRARILRLADFIEKLPRRRFDFRHWVGDDWTGDPTLSCGTTACALGWATTMPYFRRLGLRLNTRPHQFRINERKAKKIFGEFYDLFLLGLLSETVTPKQWAKYARKFVKNL